MHRRNKGKGATRGDTAASDSTKQHGVGYVPTGKAVWLNPFTGKTYPKTMDTSAHPWNPADLRSCETGVGRGGADMNLYYQRYGVSPDEVDQFKGLNPQGFTNENYYRNVCTLKGMYEAGLLGDQDEWDGGPTFEEGTDFSFEHPISDPLYQKYDCTPTSNDPNPTSDCPPGSGD